MCGIFEIATYKKQRLELILVDVARQLTYRGYDTVGAAKISGNKIDLLKGGVRVDEVAAEYNFAEITGQRGISQMRWATFVYPSQCNAQPDLDSDGDLVGAHNVVETNIIKPKLLFQ